MGREGPVLRLLALLTFTRARGHQLLVLVALAVLARVDGRAVGGEHTLVLRLFLVVLGGTGAGFH